MEILKATNFHRFCVNFVFLYLALEIAVHGWGEHEIRSARIHDNLINSKLMKFRANKFIKNMILERILWKSNEKSSLEVKNKKSG